MTRNLLWWRGLVLSTIVLCIALALSASSQDKKTSTFANVDFLRIQNEYKAKAALEGDLQAMQNKLDQALARRDTMPFLSEDEHKELDKLYDKAATARTDVEKKRIDDLEKKSQQLNNEIQALRQKPEKDLTDPDRARIKQAEDQWAKAQQNFASMKEARDNQLKQFVATNSDKLLKDVREAVRKVAEQKGLAIVFNSEVAPYAGIDITTPVLSELNKK